MLLLFKRRFTLPPSSLTTTEASRLAWCEGSVYLIFLARSCKQWCTCCKHLSTNCIDTIKKFRIFCTMLDISIQNQGPWSSVKKFYIIWSLNNTMWSTVIGVTKQKFIRRRHGLYFDTVYIEAGSLALIIFHSIWFDQSEVLLEHLNVFVCLWNTHPHSLAWAVWDCILRGFLFICLKSNWTQLLHLNANTCYFGNNRLVEHFEYIWNFRWLFARQNW